MDPANHAVVEQWGVRARNTAKSGDSNGKVAVYTNFRAGTETAEELWGSKENVDRIKKMKMRLDPVAMFQSLHVL